MRVEHEIFKTPYQVKLTMEDRPPSSSYRTRASGAGIGDTMPMWRVQTEGYQDGKGMLVGVVSHGNILEASPDGEFISGGLNTKGCESVAIGRQGNFFHWGFAASPTYMTDDAKLAFINSIHYIRKFEGQKAFVKKDAPLTLASLDDMLYGLSDEGYAAWEEMLNEHKEREKEEKAKLQERLDNGEELTDFEKRIMEMPPHPGYTRSQMIRLAPESVKKELGEDWDQYIKYYTENRDFLFVPPSEGRPLYEFHVDEDLKKLGIANSDINLLDKCIEMLADEKTAETGQRLLVRYTNQDFESAEEWKKWLDTNREVLFFSEAGGFKFLIDQNQADVVPPASEPSSAMTSEEFEEHVDALDVEEPEQGKPVKLTCNLVPVQTAAGERLRVTVKAKILDGWHIYADVPRGKPYTNTTLDAAVSEGFKASGDWEKTSPKRYFAEPGIMIWDDECVFTLDIEQVDANADPAEVQLTISYQACDEDRCMRPKKVTFDLSVEDSE